MTTIHHRFFPHLVDMVFDYAPSESLAVMAQTCREWRQRALNKFYHIDDLRVAGDSANLQVELMMIGPDPSDGLACETLKHSEIGLLAGCRILDVSDDSPVINTQLLPNLDTIRYHFDNGINGIMPARQIICAGHIYPIEKPMPVVKRLVLYSGGPSPFLYSNTYPDLSGLTSLEELVILFQDVPSALEGYDYSDSESDSDSDDDDCMDIYDGPWLRRVVEWAMYSALEQGAKVILVGTENWEPHAVRVLKLEHHFQMDDPITLMTLKQYRELVGEKEWAVETDWSNLLTP